MSSASTPGKIDGGERQIGFKNLQLTAEEQKVLDDCMRRSFYQCCMPWMGVGFLTDLWLIKRGTLRPSVFRLAAYAGGGYFLGKLMCLPICKGEVFEKVPHGELGRMAEFYRKEQERQLKVAQARLTRSGLVERLGPEEVMKKMATTTTPVAARSASTTKAATNTPSTGTPQHYNSSISFDRSQEVKGLDDSKRPNVDGYDQDPRGTKTEEPVKVRTSYRELRRKHRAEQSGKVASARPQEKESSTAILFNNRQETSEPRSFTEKTSKTDKVKKSRYGTTPVKKNLYGDELAEA